jgi:hypothetical protein
MKKNQSKNEDGYIVLISVLILGVIVSTIAAYLLISGASASVASQSVESGVIAKAASIGCAELALDAVQASPSLTTPNNSSATLNTTPNETCTYAISGTSPNYTISSVGTVTKYSGSYVHRLNITTSQTSPKITVSNWQDTP